MKNRVINFDDNQVEGELEAAIETVSEMLDANGFTAAVPHPGGSYIVTGEATYARVFDDNYARGTPINSHDFLAQYGAP